MGLFTAENNGNFDPPWVLMYDPTPDGKRNADGSTSYSLIFPALQASEYLSAPETVMPQIAAELNAHAALVEALSVVRMSAGWQHMSDETRALVDAALSKAKATA